MTKATLDGLAVIITGASRGIGKQVALELAARGASLVITSWEEAELEETRRFIEAAGGAVVSVVVDIRDECAASLIVGSAIERFGRVDALVNNAQKGRGGPAPFVDHSDADFDVAIDTGPRAAFRLMKAAYPHMKAQGGGAIVNFGSGAGTTGIPGWASYAAAKEAMRGFSKVAAYEWGVDNIRVNVVCPLARTEGMEKIEGAGNIAAMEARVPMRRIGDAREDIAGVVAFLIGPDATYITGQTIFLDGGSQSVR